MYAKISGNLDSIEDGAAIVMAGPVGYLIHASERTLRNLPPEGAAVSFVIETQVREESITLFGFTSKVERDWFRLLTTVQGVGGRLALAILGTLEEAELASSILMQDAAGLKRVSGVGPKLATRIVTELKGKHLPAHFEVSGASPAAVKTAAAPTIPVIADVLSALTNLGYGQQEAKQAIGKALEQLGNNATVTDLIPACLKELARV